MSIREDSKKIIRYFLSKAIEYGSLDSLFALQYGELAQALDFQDENYCRVCCQYLSGKGYIDLKGTRSKANPESKDMRLLLTSSAIDFLEAQP